LTTRAGFFHNVAPAPGSSKTMEPMLHFDYPARHRKHPKHRKFQSIRIFGSMSTLRRCWRLPRRYPWEYHKRVRIQANPIFKAGGFHTTDNLQACRVFGSMREGRASGFLLGRPWRRYERLKSSLPNHDALSIQSRGTDPGSFGLCGACVFAGSKTGSVPPPMRPNGNFAGVGSPRRARSNGGALSHRLRATRPSGRTRENPVFSFPRDRRATGRNQGRGRARGFGVPNAVLVGHGTMLIGARLGPTSLAIFSRRRQGLGGSPPGFPSRKGHAARIEPPRFRSGPFDRAVRACSWVPKSSGRSRSFRRRAESSKNRVLGAPRRSFASVLVRGCQSREKAVGRRHDGAPDRDRRCISHARTGSWGFARSFEKVSDMQSSGRGGPHPTLSRYGRARSRALARGAAAETPCSLLADSPDIEGEEV